MAALLPSALPIAQAPMAGGPSTPALTAAVADAGGYGYVAAGYLSVDALRTQIEDTRRRTDAAFGVNLFMPSTPGSPDAVRAYAQSLAAEAARLDTALGEPRWEDDHYDDKCALTEELRPHSVSFTFGCPDHAVVDRLHAAGIQVHVTVTSVEEAQRARAAGADALIVQGTEAGGHQGRFIGDAPNTTGLISALGALRDIGLPMLAAGAVMSGPDTRAALDAGATAVVLGTALLCAPEAATSAVYRRALLDASYADTVITRAFSGRFGRGLANRFAREHPDAPAAYPEVHHLTRPLRAAATAAGDADVPNLWAGTGWRAVTSEPAATIVRRIATDVGL